MAQRRDWVRLMVVPGLPEAELWQGLLAEEGVAALIQPNDASSYLGPQSFCTILIPAVEEERVRELIAAWQGTPDETAVGQEN